MESTLLQSFLKAANLKRWMNRTDAPPIFQELKKLFDKIYSPKATSLDEAVASNASPMDAPKVKPPPELEHLVGRQSRIAMQARVEHHEITYSTFSSHAGNSLIHFYPAGDKTSSPVAGSIQHIYCDDTSSWCLAVRRQKLLVNNSYDPFARWPHFPAKLYSPQLDHNLEKVELSWILGHYARYILSSQHAVVLSLTRVSVFSFP